MQKITSAAGLKSAIQLSEAEQSIKMKLVKDQFYLTLESFKPVNLIAGTLNDIAKSPYLVDNMAGTAIGLATGYLSKALIIGSSGNKIRRLIGTVIQFGLTNIIAQNSDSIQSFGRSLFRHFSRKNEMKTA
jgi:hypothetical protein